ncbi:MAG: hypothetical protein ACKPEY_07000 [Planctomycetota bacterium]
MVANEFDVVAAALKSGGVAAALAALSHELREAKKYHELFESLKMEVRHRIGLPLLYGDSGDELSESVRNQLEDGLIAACREVGTCLLSEGRVREGWLYLRPVGDKRAAAELLRSVEAEDERVEELIDVCLREAVDVERGFQLVLQNYGTCNAITTFESEMPRHSRADQRIAAELLLRHLYRELTANVKADIARQEGQMPSESTLRDLVAERPWLFQELSYHVDTTHLAAVVRFARLLDQPELLRLALDLTEYGRRLHSQFQYAGDEPFAELYPSHARFFQALLNEDREASLAFFRQQAEACDPSHSGTGPIEVYIDLLARVGQAQEALTASLRLLPGTTPSQGLAPSLLDLAQQSGQYDIVAEHCKERVDLLGYTAALVHAQRG